MNALTLLLLARVFLADFTTSAAEGLAQLRTLDLEAARQSLSAALELAPDERERAKVSLLLAKTYIEAGRPREAISALPPPDALPPELAYVAMFEQARAMVAAADPLAEAVLRSFLERFGDSPKATRARLMLARLLQGDEAARLAREVLNAQPSRAERAEATLILARATDDLAQKRRVFVEWPDTPAAAETGLREADLTPSELADRADAFFNAYDYEEAHRIRASLWANYERSPGLAYRLALSHLMHVRDDPKKALEFLKIAEAGGALGHAEAAFLRGKAYAKLERYDQAAKEYRRAIALGISGDRRVQAMYYQGWLPYDHGEYEKALPHFDRFLKEVKRHDLRSYILWAKAWSLYRLKRYKEAIEVFERDMIPLGNSLVAGKAIYWGGMAFHALGNKKEAARWMKRVISQYPLTYYAVLAAKRLKAWNGTPLPSWITGPAPGHSEPPPTWPFDRLPEDLAARLRLVKDFADIGEKAEARTRYAAIASEVEKRLDGLERVRWLITIYDAIEEPNALFRRAEGEFSGLAGEVPTPQTAPYWQARYPRAYQALASVLARRFAIPELWIYSIMRQESRYLAGQVSHTAALGVMQMIPKTAKIVAKALKVPFDVETFFEPGHNLLFCVWYLAQLLKEFKGQLIFASAAYNSGAPAIKRFMAMHRGAPLDEMVELIPYNEGRNYCRKVAEHMVRYAYLHLDEAERARLYEHLFPDRVDYSFGTAVNF